MLPSAIKKKKSNVDFNTWSTIAKVVWGSILMLCHTWPTGYKNKQSYTPKEHYQKENGESKVLRINIYVNGTHNGTPPPNT